MYKLNVNFTFFYIFFYILLDMQTVEFYLFSLSIVTYSFEDFTRVKGIAGASIDRLYTLCARDCTEFPRRYWWLRYSISPIDSQSARDVNDRWKIWFSIDFDRGWVKSGLRLLISQSTLYEHTVWRMRRFLWKYRFLLTCAF